MEKRAEFIAPPVFYKMIIKIKNAAELEKGISYLAEEMKITLGDDGYVFEAVKVDKPTLCVTFDGKNGAIYYHEKCQFFRGLGLAVQHINDGEESFSITEKPQFETNGVMFDLCQGNSAFTQDKSKSVIRKMALMGLNVLMFYLEDTYEVDNQPYFGYLRPRYSQSELKELDDYAYELGIEMIPCIQTLAHLHDALIWNCYASIKDYDECLLVDEPKTYEFIENLITSAIKPFRTNKIHIGMDEAWNLGTGNYLRRNGHVPEGEIMRRHLVKVCEILERHHLKPMMWDDMFMRSFGNRDYYQTGVKVPDEIKAAVPKDMGCIFWEYDGVENFEEVLKVQYQLSNNIIFAGGCWAWLGFGISTKKTLEASNMQLECIKKYGIKDVFMTTWGDHGSEILQTANLFGAQIYAENGYSDKIDIDNLKKRFKFCTGAEYDDFMLLDDLDNNVYAKHFEALPYKVNCSKFLMWQDMLLGLYDKDVEGYGLNEYYKKLTKKLSKCIGRNGDFDGLFEMTRDVSDVLAIKSEIGIMIHKAYKEGNRKELERIAKKVLSELLKRVDTLHQTHRKQWFENYKPVGWEIIDLRYGGLKARIESSKKEILDYLEGKTATIEELEQEQLIFNARGAGGKNHPLSWVNYYNRIVSASRISDKQ